MTLPCKRAFRSSIEGPPIPLSTLQAASRDVACKTRGQDGFATLLSRRALSSPTTCRFIPALSGLPTICSESPRQEPGCGATRETNGLGFLSAVRSPGELPLYCFERLTLRLRHT